MLNKVGGHLLHELEAVLHVLRSLVGVDLILFPNTNDDSCSGLADASATASGSELSNSLFIILVSEHELHTAHTDTSFARASVSIGSANSTSNLIHGDILSGAIHLLEGVLVACKASEFTSVSPHAAVVAVDTGTGAHVVNSPVISVIVELVHDLVSISLPSVLSHCLSLDLEDDIFN